MNIGNAQKMPTDKLKTLRCPTLLALCFFNVVAWTLYFMTACVLRAHGIEWIVLTVLYICGIALWVLRRKDTHRKKDKSL